MLMKILKPRARLIETYNDLLHRKSDFEVIFVAFTDTVKEPAYCPEDCFSEIFSTTPWTAIPYWDEPSREHPKTRFGVSEYSFGVTGSSSCIIGPTGKVLHCDENSLFYCYGPDGFPFSYRRLKFLHSQDKAAAKQPSLKELLGSSDRDFVISNNGKRVPIQDLEGKVVALYLYEHGRDDHLRVQLKGIYAGLKRNGQGFEVVLVNLHFTDDTCVHSNEDSFWEIFKDMPWLALPFRDWNCRKLARIYNFPYFSCEDDEYYSLTEEIPDSSLVIVGPHGEFDEPYAAYILRMYALG